VLLNEYDDDDDDTVLSADMGNCGDRHRSRRRPGVCRLSGQKAALQEAPQRQGPQEGHEGSDGRQGCSDVGRVINKGTIQQSRTERRKILAVSASGGTLPLTMPYIHTYIFV